VNHAEIDQYSTRSRWYRFDPRVKLACVVGLVLVAALTRDLASLLLLFAFSSALVLASGVPLRHLRSVLALAAPFVVFPALALLLTNGPLPALAMALRVAASVLALAVLTTTTPMFHLLRALRWYRMPALLSSLVLFTYRFIFVLLDELERMSLARRARGFTGRGHLLSREVFRTLSFTAGMTFVRAHARAMRIYDALLARGYSGEVRTLSELRAGPRDVAFIVMFLTIGALSVLLQTGALT